MEKLLQFNGTNILFVAKDGQYWVAIKPICEALNVDYIRQFKNLKNDEILSQLLSEQTMVAADKRLRKMVCLPEKFIYGWIFQLQSDSEELIKYKRTVYEIIFDYFEGALTRRENLLKAKTLEEIEMKELENRLILNEDFKRLIQLKSNQPKYRRSLQAIDQDIISEQLELWEQSLGI